MHSQLLSRCHRGGRRTKKQPNASTGRKRSRCERCGGGRRTCLRSGPIRRRLKHLVASGLAAKQVSLPESDQRCTLRWCGNARASVARTRLRARGPSGEATCRSDARPAGLLDRLSPETQSYDRCASALIGSCAAADSHRFRRTEARFVARTRPCGRHDAGCRVRRAAREAEALLQRAEACGLRQVARSARKRAANSRCARGVRSVGFDGRR